MKFMDKEKTIWLQYTRKGLIEMQFKMTNSQRYKRMHIMPAITNAVDFFVTIITCNWTYNFMKKVVTILVL